MCYREVKCVKHSCGHEAPIEDRRVDCGSNRCRYSSSHAAPCTDCSSTCNQWLRPAQMQVVRTDTQSCYHCRTSSTA
ncbi:hypothetical protein JOM56_004060 [Amanita muscaria]